MTIKLLAIGKTDNKQLQALIDEYQKRLGFYIKFNFEIVPDVKKAKKLTENELKKKEGALILNQLKPTDILILLDENGTQMDSIRFSLYLQKYMNSGFKRLVFVIGGPYEIGRAHV